MAETRVVTPAALLAVWPCHAPTPLVDLPRLATHCGVAKVVLKNEGLRPLGSFKALGGIGTIHGKSTPLPEMTAALRFSGPVLEELARARILGVRAGTEHRYTGVWVVVVEGRVFVRSWNDKPTGWYCAFQGQTLGSIQLAGREIAVRARRPWDERLRDAVTRSYSGKYDTKASEKWVRGFAEPPRAATTLELLPVKQETVGAGP